jgi:DNA-directed RNA polymerase beta subunit
MNGAQNEANFEEYLESLNSKHDTITFNEINHDLYNGSKEISDLIENAEGNVKDLDDMSNENIMKYMTNNVKNEEITGAKELVKEKAKENKIYPAEKPMKIDESLLLGDMKTVIISEMEKKKIAGHHIESMNSFNKIGIKQIMTKVFVLEGRIKNERDKTDEDKEISEITYKVDFTDVNLHQPSTVRYKSGKPQLLTPNLARTKNLTYSCQMFIDATITATAFFKNGTTKTRTAEIKNHRVASIPCAVGTELCNTFNSTKESLKSIEEDPLNPGGYFIIKGVEWTVDNLENITNNTFHVHKNMFMNEIVRGVFLSKPGDAFENSYQVILRLLNTGMITIEITTNKFDKFEIPFYLIFMALGMTSEYDIIDHIVYGVENEDRNTKTMHEILKKSFAVKSKDFGPIQKSTDSTEIIQFIAQRIIDGAKEKSIKKDDNVIKYLNNNILNIIDRFIFPHIGTEIEHRISKLRFFGHLINRLLSIDMGISHTTDRDSYKNKRITASGTSSAKTLKTVINFVIIQEIKKQFAKDFKSTPFSNVQLAESVKSAINSDDLERMLIQSITTGNKTITIKRNEITNRISSQILNHKNDMNIKSILNTVNTPNTTSSKQNERADIMRRVQSSYVGFIDPSQSPDSGEKVGMAKQMCITASICGASSSYVLKKILYDDPNLLKLDDVSPSQISKDKLSKVFVNGDWIGCCERSDLLVKYYRQKRRYGDIHHLTTIIWEPLFRECYFWTDVGRMMRPLMIVYSNIKEYNENYINGDRTMKFHQWIKFTKQHKIDLESKKITIDDLVKERVIEYVSPGEQENLLLAYNINKLKEHEFDLLNQFTHCDIDQAIFGIVTLTGPHANLSNAVRNTMYSNHRRQSAGWYALNFPFRIDKNVTFQHYCEMPLVTTLSDSISYPNGQNAIIALALHGGMNQEDSIEVNKSSVDCGMFNASFYNYEKVELDKNEKFGNSDYARTIDIKKDAIYEHIGKNGLIKEGTLAKKGDVLIVKTANLPKSKENYSFADKSIVYNRDESIYIDRAIIVRNDEDAEIAKVKFRSNRPLGVGDKLCLAPDHSVLTKEGWKPVAEVTIDDFIATNNNGMISYRKPTKLYNYDHDGEMYKINSKYIKGLVTPNHRMFVRINGNWVLQYAKDIIGRKVIYTSHGMYKNHILEDYHAGQIYDMDDFLTLFGLFVVKGKLLNNMIIIENISRNESKILNDLVTRMNLISKRCLNSVSIDNAYIYDKLAYYNGRFPDFIWELDLSQALIVFRSIFQDSRLICMENPHDSSNYIFTPINHHYSESIVRLGFHVGIRCTIMNNNIIIHENCTPIVNFHEKEDMIVNWQGKVYCLEVPNHIFLTKYKNTYYWTGNSSKCGNKGIVSVVVPRADMPYCENGEVPDVIVSALSVTTRMAVGQIAESVEGILAAFRGSHIDATAFLNFDIDQIKDELVKYGIEYGGHKRMYNGKTGDWIDTLIFSGPTTYQRLQKFVIDERYAIRAGPTSALTRQPLDGKNNDGGLRLGEMEKDVIASHGTMRQFHSKFYDDSDGITVPICRICGNRAITNEKYGIYKCKYCGDKADIANVFSSWASNLFINEVSAMNIKMIFELSPYTYSRYE